MIKRLAIKNYALIEDLSVDFSNGLTIITGETGAGKSILLGALSLLLGKRADLSSVRDTSKKCVLEADFEVGGYGLESLYDEQDLDYDPHTIVRREILPSGKSRAFVNDTPVTLNQLQALGVRLVDIHSQNETLVLSSESFQFEVIDALAGTASLVNTYTRQFGTYRFLKKELNELRSKRDQAHKELDYNTFLFTELQEANLEHVNLEELENIYETLSNSEEIQESLSKAIQIMDDESHGALEQLKESRAALSRISGITSDFGEFWERLNSAIIELEDLSEGLKDGVLASESDPQRMEEVNDKLQLIYKLQQKHTVASVEELLAIKDDLEGKIDVSHGMDAAIERLEAELAEAEDKAQALATQLHQQRSDAIPRLQEKIEGVLETLGLPNARLRFDLKKEDVLQAFGWDRMELLFTANLGTDFGLLKKVASGGELSRIMLAVKSVLADYKNLPTIVFDEIDSGVSGEIANKIAAIMNRMSKSMQLLTITHLPQVAAKGDQHLLVYKEDVNKRTETRLKMLQNDDRIVEIAKMIGGNSVTEAALANARELLN